MADENEVENEAEPSSSAPTAPAFAVGDAVRTRRHGPARVVAVDALGVTVEFDNGQQRSFMPQFLAAVKPRERGRRGAPGA